MQHLSVISRVVDAELARIDDAIELTSPVGGRGELEELLCRRLETADSGAKTLDLIGHATADGLLELGSWVIDGSRPVTRAFFRGLADSGVLARLGIVAIRLLGCETAYTDAGRRTLRVIADAAGIPVFGTTAMIYSAHYERTGFRAECAHVLVAAESMTRVERSPIAAEPYRRRLDIEALPVSYRSEHRYAWPRRVASGEHAKRFLALIRRADGAQMPGLLAAPSHEVALPAATPNTYFSIQVLLNAEFVRVYFDERGPGIVFPVSDASSMRLLLETLSAY
jgi:hypothetical protein